MFETTHALAGAALGSLAGGPVSAFALGLASHAVLDAIPHWDYRTVPAAVVDVLVGAVAVGAAAAQAADPAPVIAGAVGAVLPDVEVALKALGRWPWRLFYPSHTGRLPHPAAPLPWGVLTQLAVAAAALLAL
ncbi:MAG: hypothetical protein FWJ62_02185 [Thermaerobacter sp.]